MYGIYVCDRVYKISMTIFKDISCVLCVVFLLIYAVYEAL